MKTTLRALLAAHPDWADLPIVTVCGITGKTDDDPQVIRCEGDVASGEEPYGPQLAFFCEP